MTCALGGAAVDLRVHRVQLAGQRRVPLVDVILKAALARCGVWILGDLEEAARDGAEVDVVATDGQRDQIRARVQAIRLRRNHHAAATIPRAQHVVRDRAAARCVRSLDVRLAEHAGWVVVICPTTRLRASSWSRDRTVGGVGIAECYVVDCILVRRGGARKAGSQGAEDVEGTHRRLGRGLTRAEHGGEQQGGSGERVVFHNADTTGRETIGLDKCANPRDSPRG